MALTSVANLSRSTVSLLIRAPKASLSPVETVDRLLEKKLLLVLDMTCSLLQCVGESSVLKVVYVYMMLRD